nr:glycosyltransferase [Sphingobacterium shayense]
MNSISFSRSRSKLIYRPILNKFSDRILYRRKIRKISNDIEKQVDLAAVSIMHAHTWFSDGGAAYLLNKKYSIPYIVAVRSSDIVYFYKYLLWEREFAREILKNAERVVFISESYHRIFRTRMVDKWLDFAKIEVIPNGIDEFWIKNRISDIDLLARRMVRAPVRILYVGQLIKRKNADKLAEAIRLLNRDGISVELQLVGDFSKSDFNELAFSEHDNVKVLGQIKDKNKLLEIYRQNDYFAMPSVNETFGLVYVEALTQGLPILFTKNDGIDGFYADIGESVEKPVTVDDIVLKLKKMIGHEPYRYDLPLICENHDWINIANRYKAIYHREKKTF